MPAGVEGFEAGRLTMAREARALRQRELAAKIQKTEATVSKWENGNQRPEPSIIPDLAASLAVDPLWFFKPLDPDRRAVFYRSLVSELQLLRGRARARLGFVEAMEQALSEHIDFPDVDIPDVTADIDFRDLRSDDIEAIGSELRSHWALEDGPISDVLLLLENAGAVVSEDTIDSVKLDGVSWWSGRTERPYVLLAKDKKAGVRRRFDAAHELAHLVIHRKVTPEDLVKHFTLIEDQAMALAGTLLMPAKEFRSSVYSLSLDGLLRLKEEWGVSVGAMVKRLANLGEISEHNERRLWQYYSARRWRTREPLDDVIPIERPQNLKSAVEMIVLDKSVTKKGLLSDIGLLADDVTTLCGLSEDFFESAKPPMRSILSLRADDQGENDAINVVPFRSRDQ